MSSGARRSNPQFRNQDARVRDTFELLSAWLVDILFNHIYSSAKAGVASGGSLTDEYTRGTSAFVLGAKTDKQCFSDVVTGLHRYFTSVTRFSTLSFADFVDRVVGACVPAEYFADLSSADKDEVLGSVVCSLISETAAFMTTPAMLRRVIDEHDAAHGVTVRMAQDAAVGALFTKRAELVNSFLRRQGQARSMLPPEALEGLKRALRRLAREKADATARADDAEEAIDGLRAEIRDGRAREAKLRKLVALLRSGAAEGPEAAGRALDLERRVPRREAIAEAGAGARAPPRRPPRRDQIAENDSASEESGSGESGSEESGSEEELYSPPTVGNKPLLHKERRPSAQARQPPAPRAADAKPGRAGRGRPGRPQLPPDFFAAQPAAAPSKVFRG